MDQGHPVSGVIYYNYIKPEVAAELLEAASIMGIDVRIGVEVKARLREKYVRLIWSPRGFLGRVDFLGFLEEPEVQAFLTKGQAVVEYEKLHVLDLQTTLSAASIIQVRKFHSQKNATFIFSMPGGLLSGRSLPWQQTP